MTVLACTYGQREVDGVEGKRFEQIIVTVEAGIAEVTLNRPDRYNALGSRMVGELGEALEEIVGSGEVRAMILTGAGDRAFCSGVDLKERAEMDADGRWSHNRTLGAFAGRLARLQVPTFAALNGLAFGGGLEIALAGDFRLTAEGASFALPEIAANSPLALAYAKAAVDLASETTIEQGLRYETAAIRATLTSEDYKIGLAAFAEKRPPEFPPLTSRRMT